MASSKIPAVKAALVTKFRTLFPTGNSPEVYVTYGLPDSLAPDNIIAVMDAHSDQDFGQFGSSTRRREEHITQTIVISCYMGGDSTAQQIVTEQAFSILEAFYVDTETGTTLPLGGLVREMHITGVQLTESTLANSAQGRVAELEVTLGIKVRI